MAAFYNDTDLFSGEFWHPLVFTPQPRALNSSFLPTNTNPQTPQPQASYKLTHLFRSEWCPLVFTPDTEHQL